MEFKFNIVVRYDDAYINDIIENHQRYATKTNTICPKIETILASEIEDLIMNYANADSVEIKLVNQ